MSARLIAARPRFAPSAPLVRPVPRQAVALPEPAAVTLFWGSRKRLRPELYAPTPPANFPEGPTNPGYGLAKRRPTGHTA